VDGVDGAGVTTELAVQYARLLVQLLKKSTDVDQQAGCQQGRTADRKEQAADHEYGCEGDKYPDAVECHAEIPRAIGACCLSMRCTVAVEMR
jgi:hypothetical protein